MKILVTGGAGFIGSHTCVELLRDHHEVVIFDNFSNSNLGVVQRIGRICGAAPVCIEGDLLRERDVDELFRNNNFNAVIHFAAKKAVGESVQNPLLYYRNNINGAINLLGKMEETGVSLFVFSSSATVYGKPDKVPITESESIKPTNPYGHSKAMIEQVLIDQTVANEEFKVALLRYFNPAGAHSSGLLGESPRGIPNNLVPFIMQVAAGEREKLRVFGNDYPTPDGTGVRDYIHIVDLAKAHVKVLNYLSNQTSIREPLILNIGTGEGHSVLEVISVVEEISGRIVPYEIVERRKGDVASCYADVQKVNSEIGWKSERDLIDMCRDAWNWKLRSREK